MEVEVSGWRELRREIPCIRTELDKKWVDLREATLRKIMFTFGHDINSGRTVLFRWGDVIVEGGLERDNVLRAFHDEHFDDRDRRVVAANMFPLSPRPRRRVKVYRFLLTGLVHT